MWDREISRRRFFQGLAVIGAAAALEEGEDRLTEHYFPDNPTKLYALPQSLPLFEERQLELGEGVPMDQLRVPEEVCFDEMYISMQGMGRQHGREYAERMVVNALEGPASDRPMSYFDYSPRGINRDELAGQLVAPHALSRSVSYSGISLGTPNSLEPHRRLAESGLVVPTRRFFEVCSPHDLDDLTDPILARFAAVLSQLVEGGVASKLITSSIEMANFEKVPPDASIVDRAKWLWHNATHGSPPRMENSQMRMFATADFDSPTYGQIINSDTEAILVACADEREDEIVRCRQSREKWAAWFANKGARVTLVDNPRGSGHANTEVASQRIRPHVVRSYKAE